MKVLLFGATGSAGGSVLRACLDDPAVQEVRAIARRPLELRDPRLRVYEHADYLDYAPVAEAFAGVDACCFCLGISVRQVSGEAEYRRITRDFPMAAAQALQAGSPGALFHYLSGMGAGLDSRFMWARVKAEAERDLVAAHRALCWRPASIDGVPSRSEPRLYAMLRPVMRLARPFRSLYVAGEDIGRAMLYATRHGMRGRVIENPEIRDLADRHRAER